MPLHFANPRKAHIAGTRERWAPMVAESVEKFYTSQAAATNVIFNIMLSINY
jgi:hypothetical protein